MSGSLIGTPLSINSFRPLLILLINNNFSPLIGFPPTTLLALFLMLFGTDGTDFNVVFEGEEAFEKTEA
jgi:hypothetical protein